MNITMSLERLSAFVDAIDEQIARKDCDETIDPLDMIEALLEARKALDARLTPEEKDLPHIVGNVLQGVYVCPTESMLDLLKAIDEVKANVEGGANAVDMSEVFAKRKVFK
ncbi:MAG: hypothetical protein ACYDH4_09545 [Candidatus Cryosericum sp.]